MPTLEKKRCQYTFYPFLRLIQQLHFLLQYNVPQNLFLYKYFLPFRIFMMIYNVKDFLIQVKMNQYMLFYAGNTNDLTLLEFIMLHQHNFLII